MKKSLSLVAIVALGAGIVLAGAAIPGCGGVDNTTSVPKDAGNYDTNEEPVGGDDDSKLPQAPNPDDMPVPGKEK